MGFFNTVMSLLDEKSDSAFEKKMSDALDKVEHVLGATVDKAETSVKKLDSVSQRASKVIDTVDQQAKKLDKTPAPNDTTNA